jgi:outer membrane murein-binding lipoprotein Lpp
MKRLPLMVAVLGVILLSGCHDRRAGVKTLLGDGVEQYGQVALRSLAL